MNEDLSYYRSSTIRAYGVVKSVKSFVASFFVLAVVNIPIIVFTDIRAWLLMVISAVISIFIAYRSGADLRHKLMDKNDRSFDYMVNRVDTLLNTKKSDEDGK